VQTSLDNPDTLYHERELHIRMQKVPKTQSKDIRFTVRGMFRAAKKHMDALRAREHKIIQQKLKIASVVIFSNDVMRYFTWEYSPHFHNFTIRTRRALPKYVIDGIRPLVRDSFDFSWYSKNGKVEVRASVMPDTVDNKWHLLMHFYKAKDMHAFIEEHKIKVVSTELLLQVRNDLKEQLQFVEDKVKTMRELEKRKKKT